MCVLTNGRLLTEEIVSLFTEYPPKSIQLSLYGSSEDTYEEVTGHRAFQEVMKGIERVKKADLPLRISITPSRYMKNDMSELLTLVHTLHVPYQIGEVTLPARPETGRRIDEYAIDIDSYISLLKEELDYIKPKLNVEEELHQEDFYVPPLDEKQQGLQCGAGRSGFHVNWRGEMCPCAAFSTVHYDIQEDGFAEAWRKVGDSVISYKPPQECTECPISEYCITCSAEKTSGSLCGNLNRAVCQRLQRVVDEKVRMV